MTNTQLSTAEKLQRISRYKTRYELIVSCPEASFLVAYTSQRGRRGIMEAAYAHAAELIAMTGGQYIQWGKLASDGGTMGVWSIRFSGRTQREAIIMGELPYVGAKS